MQCIEMIMSECDCKQELSEKTPGNRMEIGTSGTRRGSQDHRTGKNGSGMPAITAWELISGDNTSSSAAARP